MKKSLILPALLAALLPVWPTGAAHAFMPEAGPNDTCFGKPVTITHPVGTQKIGLVTYQVFQGTGSDDVIIGTDGPDIIYGNGGADTVCARGGNDQVYVDPRIPASKLDAYDQSIHVDLGYGDDAFASTWPSGGPYDPYEGFADGGEYVRGGPGADRIVALGHGHNTVWADAGRFTIGASGGPDDDCTVVAGEMGESYGCEWMYVYPITYSPSAPGYGTPWVSQYHKAPQ